MPRFLKSCTVFFSLFILFSMTARSQNPVKNYTKEWKEAEAFIEKSLPQSAMTVVKKIYALAKKDKQDAQVIKSLIYMGTLQEEIREDNDQLNIAEIEKEITTSREPATSILKSHLAELYWNYFNKVRWTLYNRTQTVSFKKDDIATWGAEDFHKKTTELFLASVKEYRMLQQTKLEPFEALITKGNMRHLRPTLYDLLAFRALAYFENDEKEITKPAYAFEIDQASAFDPAADFATRKFITRDSLSDSHKAILLYQQLIAFHLNDSKPDALIDADLQRLAYIKDKSVHPDKDKLYYTALNHIARQYGNLPAASQAWFLMASELVEKANDYKPHGDTTHRYDKVKAKEILETILAQKDSSEGKTNAYNLIRDINARSLEFKLEKVNIPSQAFRALVTYRNISKLHLRIIKADDALKKLLASANGEKYWPGLINAKVIRSWEQNLPDTKDYQSHAAEIKIDGLPSGEYYLLAGNEKDYNTKSIVGARFFYVSAISYVSNNRDLFVLNRDNGRPLANASVQLWNQQYDYKQSKYIDQKGKLYTTDAHGYTRLDRNNDPNQYSYNYKLEIKYNDEHLFMEDWNYEYYNREPETNTPKVTTSVFLFTDRSIYRPGQTVYFKGIVLIRNEADKRGSARKDYRTTVYLRDANYKDIDTINVQTNEYGSFSGKFQLPMGSLNGAFSVHTKQDGGAASFNVEEYKRPKFYVDYESIKGTYKVNDQIKVTGTAKAYAGNNIDGALVKYRIVRQPRFIYTWYFWRWWQPPVEEMEITHGETKTDKDGKFTVEFTAIPDLTLDKKYDPVFDYTIYADVTDINGETRSGEQMVTVGYKALMLVTDIPAGLPADSLRNLTIRTQNMSGEHEPATVKVTITRLLEEKRLIRSRLWDRPDQFTMTKPDYISTFPNDEYDNETDFKSWEKGAQALQVTDSSHSDGTFGLGDKTFTPGYYMIEMESRDKNGEPVKDIRYIELSDTKSNQLTNPSYTWQGENKTRVEPGENASIQWGTSADNLFVVQLVDKKDRNSPFADRYSFFDMNNTKRTFVFPVTADDKGGYGVGWLFVKHNRIYQSSSTIDVPWTDKELKIEYTSYRDKTLPGAEEKWSLKISGMKNEKVAAEMLATMYDASLDQFNYHGWSAPSIWPNYYRDFYWNEMTNFSSIESNQRYAEETNGKELYKQYDYILSTMSGEYLTIRTRGNLYLSYNSVYKDDISGAVADRAEMKVMAPPPSVNELSVVGYDKRVTTKKDGDADGIGDVTDKKPNTGQQDPGVKIRKNFNETAFFFPDLRTDSTGAISFSFTMPEALTKWKFMALAHTKDAAFGYSTHEIVTQKDLMVQPNAPRFLREGDKMEFSTKIVNLSSKELTGTVELQLVDATTNEPVDGRFRSMVPNQYFTVAAGQSEAVKFPIEVPYQFNNALVWRVIAKAGDYSDGEENALPVLTNRMLVTETMPMPMRGTGTKNFSFDKLLNSGSSETLQQYSLSLEYTSNPAWYAVQALPYLMEYPYECAEQTWNRYYANSLATFIANSSPRIKQVFEKWKIKDTAALMSNLEKNQELKAVMLEETPWVLQAKNESEQKKNIALLFDMIRMSEQLNSAYDKLKNMQSSNGGFVWFKGGPDDRYITQYIVTGIGHLKKLKAYAPGQSDKLNAILTSAIPYLDAKLKEDYDNLVKYKVNLKTYTPGYTTIQFLYMRSFFPEVAVAKASQAAYNYFRERTAATWTTQSKYMQGMTALSTFRTGDLKTPAAILKSLKETAIVNEELGMYWKDQVSGWFWYEAPVETVALLAEAFQEAGKDDVAVNDLKTWLLKNKQTTNWKTTKATAEACYALLIQGTNWLVNEPVVEIKLGSMTVKSTENNTEAGTGYFKKIIEGNKVRPDMGKISVTVSNPAANGGSPVSWGAVYWQYFEDLDKITSAATPLKLVKKLFIETNSDRGPVLTPVNENTVIKVGDKIKVRIELRVDRDMEYVHMKDMRASSLEPVNVISSYKYQGGLGYYESTKDASTNFFFSYLRKGTYVFEYPLFATHTGNFSNGITTIQCMYAPEFTSHSEGVRINVE